MEAQKKAVELRKEKGKNYTKKELGIMAKAAGILYFYRLNKHDLAGKLGIELPRPRRPFSRAVEIRSLDGKIVTYASMIQADKSVRHFSGTSLCNDCKRRGKVCMIFFIGKRKRKSHLNKGVKKVYY